MEHMVASWEAAHVDEAEANLPSQEGRPRQEVAVRRVRVLSVGAVTPADPDVTLRGKVPMGARYRLAAVVSACALVLIAFASPARAHDSRIYGPYACGVPKFSLCGYAQVRDNHEIVDACDTRADGDGYFVRYRVRSGAVGTVGNGNGSAAGCGIKRVGSPTIPIVAYQGCTDQNLWPRNNCTPWESA
jgi:hypothetical protein